MQRIHSLSRPVLADVGLALVLVAVSVERARPFLFPDDEVREKLIAVSGSQGAFDRQLLLWWLGAAGAAVAVAIRRRWPLAAFLLAGAAAILLLSDRGIPESPLPIAVVITLYTLASLTGSRRVGIAALAGALVAASVLMTNREPALSAVAVPILLLGAAWALGDGKRTRRIHLATLEDRAAGLQREQEQRARLAVAAERVRITRELHDVVAHGISVMVVQAQAAAAAIHTRPERSLIALEHVVTTGRASLAEMRRLLGLVRSGVDDESPLVPSPGLASVPTLIDEVRSAGTPVTLRIDGEPVPLPATVDLSVYRIVQEALTNTRKHAGAAATASVRLAFRPGWLDIDVSDDGQLDTRGADGEGNGLRGIAERVGALGGRVQAGPRAGGGFALRATLPVETT